jgi:hypothetical protein
MGRRRAPGGSDAIGEEAARMSAQLAFVATALVFTWVVPRQLWKRAHVELLVDVETDVHTDGTLLVAATDDPTEHFWETVLRFDGTGVHGPGIVGAVFDSEEQALLAVLALRDLNGDGEAWRIGVHTGELVWGHRGCRGPTLRYSRHLLRAAHEGQTLVSSTTAQAVIPEDEDGGDAPADAAGSSPIDPEHFVSLGFWRLRVLTLADASEVYAFGPDPASEPPLLPAVVSTRLLRRIHDAYGEAYRRAYEDGRDSFDGIEGVDAVDRERIRPRVLEAASVTAMYDAWRDLPKGLLDFALPPLLILAVAGWFTLLVATSGGVLQAIGSILVAVGVVVTLLLSLFVVGVESDRAFVLWLIGLLGALAVLLHGVIDTDDDWPRLVLRTFDLTAITVAGTVAVIGLLLVAERAVVIFHQRRKLTTWPDEEIIDQLVLILTGLHAHRSEPSSDWWRTEVVSRIDWLAYTVERRVPPRTIRRDVETAVWSRDTHRQIATDIRRSKRHVILPGPGDLERLYSDFSRLLVMACDSHWDGFGRSEAPPLRYRRARVYAAMRAVAIVATPLVLVAAVILLPVDIDAELQRSLVTTGIAWGVVTTLNMIDPRAADRLPFRLPGRD